MAKYELTVRKTEFSEGKLIIESDEEPNFIQYDEFVRLNMDKINFTKSSGDHWRVTHVNDTQVMKEVK